MAGFCATWLIGSSTADAPPRRAHRRGALRRHRSLARPLHRRTLPRRGTAGRRGAVSVSRPAARRVAGGTAGRAARVEGAERRAGLSVRDARTSARAGERKHRLQYAARRSDRRHGIAILRSNGSGRRREDAAARSACATSPSTPPTISTPNTPDASSTRCASRRGSSRIGRSARITCSSSTRAAWCRRSRRRIIRASRSRRIN